MFHEGHGPPPDLLTLHFVGGRFDGAREHIPDDGAYVIGEGVGRLVRDDQGRQHRYESCVAWEGGEQITLYSAELPCWFVHRAAGLSDDPDDSGYEGWLADAERWRDS